MQLKNVPAVRREINSRMKSEEYKRPLSQDNLKLNSAPNCSAVSDDQNACQLLKPYHTILSLRYKQSIGGSDD
jgi:hypothetical protein